MIFAPIWSIFLLCPQKTRVHCHALQSLPYDNFLPRAIELKDAIDNCPSVTSCGNTKLKFTL